MTRTNNTRLTKKEHGRIFKLFKNNLMSPKDIGKLIGKRQATVYRSLTQEHGIDVANYLRTAKTRIVVDHIKDFPSDWKGAAENASCATSTARYYYRNRKEFIGAE